MMSTFVRFSVTGCKVLDSGMCPYEEFVKLTKHVIPGDWNKECEIPKSKDADDRKLKTNGTHCLQLHMYERNRYGLIDMFV